MEVHGFLTGDKTIANWEKVGGLTRSQEEQGSKPSGRSHGSWVWICKSSKNLTSSQNNGPLFQLKKCSLSFLFIIINAFVINGL